MQAKYLEFLEYLMDKLGKYFDEQAPYIKCEKGCAKCCSNGDYPFTEIEVELLKFGFSKLNDEKKQIIKNNISKILKDKANHKSEDRFTYSCPFLIDNVCSVYLYRGIICRTFGLIYIKEGANMQIPFCAYDNLNYSNVLDKNTNMLVEEKKAELGIEVEPKAYNIHWDFLTSDRVAHAFGFEYGKKGSLIDLLKDDEDFKSD